MGRVKSLKFGKEKLLKQQITKIGYCLIKLSKNNKHKAHSVHRLVAQAFIPNSNNYPCVNHKNEIKTDNRADNLEWVTQKQNCNYGTHNEKLSITHKGLKHTQETKDKMSESHQIPIIQIHQSGLIIGVYDSTIQASNKLGIDNGSITKCLKGKRKSAGGFKWMYLNELKKAG
jgi:hypothetical protein